MTDTTASASTTTPAPPTAFVGNLPKTADEAAVREHFTKDNKVKIQSVKVIHPRTSNRVFGFVTVDTDAELKKVIDIFHDQEMGGRKLKVQVATPEKPERPPRQPRPPRNNNNNNAGDNAGGAAPAEKRRSRPKAANAGGDAPLGGGPGDSGQPAAAAGGPQNSGDAKPKRQRKKRPAAGGAAGGAAAGAGSGAAAAAAPASASNNTNANANGSGDAGGGGGTGGEKRRTRKRKPHNSGDDAAAEHEPIDPTTTLFVANLPFAVDDARLKEVMAGPVGSVVSARVVRDRFSNNSKGYGFVSYNDTAARDAALAKNNQMDCDGRVLTINVAKAQPPKVAAAAAAAAAAAGTADAK